MTTKPQLLRLIKAMLKAFAQLGRDPMARIDARLFHEYFKKKVERL